jgi:hypothetical protein
MRTQRAIHSQMIYMTIVFSLSLVMGVLAFYPSKNMAMAFEDSSKDLPPVLKEGQIVIEGEVTRVQGEFVGENFSQMNDQRYVVETPLGGKWDLRLGKNTQIIGDIFLGDQVTAKIGRNGTLQMVQKIEQIGSPQDSMGHHRITGIVERNEEEFLFVKKSDPPEHMQLDKENFEGDSREGSHKLAQGGDAGYAIPIQDFESEPEGNSPKMR